MHMLIRFAILVGAFLLMSLLPGVRLKSFGTAVVCALVFSLINFFFGWLLKVLLVIGTLGLAFFALNFLTNMVVLWITDKAIDGFEIRSFGTLVLATLILSLASYVSFHMVYAY